MKSARSLHAAPHAEIPQRSAAASGATLGPRRSDRRAVTPYRVAPAEALGPLSRVHENLTLRLHIDPNTGRSPVLGFVRPPAGPLIAFELHEPR